MMQKHDIRTLLILKTKNLLIFGLSNGFQQHKKKVNWLPNSLFMLMEVHSWLGVRQLISNEAIFDQKLLSKDSCCHGRKVDGIG